jgi:oligopeptide transport system ATP-binding protein
MSTPGDALVRVEGLHKIYSRGRREAPVRALDGVSLEIGDGESVGLIGESGCGKSTLGRCLLGLIRPSGGSVQFDGVDLASCSRRELRALRSSMQIVYQEPREAFDPRIPMLAQITEPLRALTSHSKADRLRIGRELLDRVGLQARVGEMKPRMLSGGMLQRCAIARAISIEPKLIVLDEPTSALPPSTAARIVEIFREIRADLGLALLVISHDLELVDALCERISVMYLGQIVEEARAGDFFTQALHPYGRALLSASLVAGNAGVPARRPAYKILQDEIGSGDNAREQCYLAPRCPYRLDQCSRIAQELQPIAAGRFVRCWRVTDASSGAKRFLSGDRSFDDMLATRPEPAFDGHPGQHQVP